MKIIELRCFGKIRIEACSITMKQLQFELEKFSIAMLNKTINEELNGI